MPFATDSLTAGRRWFIAIGVGRYEHLAQDRRLHSVAADVELMSALFARFGYDRALPELGCDPGHGCLRDALSEWFAAAERRPDDVVVLYYSGHGVVRAARHYLLAGDSRERNLAGTALPADELVRMVGQGPVRHVLVLLDTCHAGVAINELAATARSLVCVRPTENPAGSGLWWVAAARPKEAAEEGVFATAWSHAVAAAATTAGAHQPYLQPLDLVHAVNAELVADGRRQRVRANLSDVSGKAPFLPNPSYVEGLPDGVDLAAQRHLVARGSIFPRDLTEHFDPRGRGVEFATELGWYFRGRRRVLGELAGWLSEPEGDGRIRVVTSKPGSGKSAVLARLVALANPATRNSIPRADVPASTLPPAGCIDLAVHLRNRRAEDLVAAVSAAAGVAATDPEQLVAAMAARRRPFTLVVDALDEAGSLTQGAGAEPARIAWEVLRPLGTVPGLRLLIGTRSSPIKALGGAIEVLDLDDPANVEFDDLVAYVAATLVMEGDPARATPYRGRGRLTEEVSRVVAERAYPNFLVARMLALGLAAEQAPVQSGDATWRDHLPSTVGGAFDAYLRRFGDDETRTRRLLAPLAYAEGAGLPWDGVWAPLASALSGSQCTDVDVEWLLDVAGSYIVESSESDRAVYRLYHQALAEHLRPARVEVRAQARLSGALRALAASGPDSAQADWFAAHPYVRRYLPVHAAAAEHIDDLLDDPGFLLAADSDRLLGALNAARSRSAIRTARLYRSAVPQLRGRPPADGASYLELHARQLGLDDYADRVAAARFSQRWRVPWTRWAPRHPHQIIGRHPEHVWSVALCTLADRAIVLSGDERGTVRVWDLLTGLPVGPPFQHGDPSRWIGGGGRVECLTLAELDGRQIVASLAGSDLRVWDLITREPLSPPLVTDPDQESWIDDHDIEAMEFCTLDGAAVLVTAHGAGSLRIRDPLTGRRLGEPMRGHQRWAHAVAVDVLDGRAIAASGGEDRTVLIWDLATTAQLSAPLTGHKTSVLSVAFATIDNRRCLLSGDLNGEVRIWDVRSHRPYGSPLRNADQVDALAIGALGGRPIVVCPITSRQSLQVWDLTSRQPLGQPLSGHSGHVPAVAVGELLDRPVAVSSSGDRTVRMWELDAISDMSEPRPGHAGAVYAVAACQVDGRWIVISAGDDHTVRRWELATGEPVGEPLRGHSHYVTDVAVAEHEGRQIAVSAGGHDNAVRVWDVRTGKALATLALSTKSFVASAAFARLGSTTLVIVAELHGARLHVFDLAMRAQVGEPLQCGSEYGEIYTLAVGALNGRPMAIATGGEVHVWDLAAGSQLSGPREAHETWSRAVAVANIEGRPTVVSGDDHGLVLVWDLVTGETLGRRRGASGVYAVALGDVDDRIVVLAGGFEGSLDIWDLHAGDHATIEVGASIKDMALGPGGTVALATEAGLATLDVSGLWTPRRRR